MCIEQCGIDYSQRSRCIPAINQINQGLIHLRLKIAGRDTPTASGDKRGIGAGNGFGSWVFWGSVHCLILSAYHASCLRIFSCMCNNHAIQTAVRAIAPQYPRTACGIPPNARPYQQHRRQHARAGLRVNWWASQRGRGRGPAWTRGGRNDRSPQAKTAATTEGCP